MSNPQGRSRYGTTLLCYGCNEELPAESFGNAKPYADGSPRKKSNCRPCSAKQARKRAERQGLQKIMHNLAPEVAIQRLLEERPQIKKDLARKYKFDYMRLLEEERKNLIEARNIYLANAQVARDRRKANDK